MLATILQWVEVDSVFGCVKEALTLRIYGIVG
jgi:hypothetical protein